jgi:hypothetical protein
MSIVFLKSDDKQNGSTLNSHNPNTPSRFSNYLTQPVRLPPNSQVGYVSSQYSLGQSIDLNLKSSFLNTAEEGKTVMNMPIQMINQNREIYTDNTTAIINDQVLSANEFGMDGDYTGLTYKNVFENGELQKQSDTGIIQIYDKSTDKTKLRIELRKAIDQYNLYFNSLGSNPSFDSTDWTPNGATVPAGLNFTNKVDPIFQNDIQTIQTAYKSFNRPQSCFGFVTGLVTNLINAKARITQGNTNFYNTGFLAQGIEENPEYDWTAQAGTVPLPNYDDDNYGVFFSTAGIKKQIGNFTPSNEAQQSNLGGHITPGGFNITSGGYGIQGFSNTDRALVDLHYSASVTDRVGYCGIAPFYAGVQSIPAVQQIGYQYAKEVGNPESASRGFDLQLQYFNFNNTLNRSNDSQNPEGAVAHYLFGMKGQDVLVDGQQNFQISCEILNPSLTTGTNDIFTNANFSSIGRTLDVYKLSKGINTATDDGSEYTFDAGANYSINVYDSFIPRVNAALFFRYRWVNKNQMNIEFTLSVDGYAGTYESSTDEPYEPPGFIAPAPSVPSTPVQNIALDATTTGGSTNITSQTTFTDSGGGSGDYNPNESYEHTFVAPSGLNASFTINNIEFEHSSFSMYDRLGVQSSPDGVTWTNVSFAGFRSSATATAPWSTSFGSPSTPGWIFPRDTATLSSLGGNPSQTFDVGERYVKFTFESDSSVQEPGWSLSMNAIDPGTTPNANDPRDKWVTLSTMNIDTTSYYIPSYMGDIGMIYYPIAGVDGLDDNGSLRSLQKGWLDVRQTNRYFRDNNNGGGQQYAPFSNDNPAYNENGLGILVFDSDNPEDADFTSSNLINGSFSAPSVFSSDSGKEGTFDLRNMYYLGVPLSTTTSEFYNMIGSQMFDLRTPETEVGLSLGYNDIGSSQEVLDLEQDSTLLTLLYTLVGVNTVQPTSNSSTNHFQLTNLPIKSQNGVVSSVSKTIYITNTLCVTKTQDEGTYRFFCDRTTFPIWIDLNNLETIELNKIDVLVTTDDNIEQRNLKGTTELVIMFRQKETGILPNSIPTNSMSMTRTY